MRLRRVIVSSFATNCYLLEHDGKCIIVDPGDDKSMIVKGILELEAEPIAILLTHGHCDHIGAVSELKKEYGIKVYAHEEEKDVMMNCTYNLSQMFGLPIAIQADEWLTDGQILKIGDFKFRVIHTPGHTKGSCCYLMETEKVMFSGDTLFWCSRGRTDFPTGSESTLIRSICDKLLCLDDDIRVFAGHNQDTTIGDERAYYPT